jgi:hypothetical protein
MELKKYCVSVPVNADAYYEVMAENAEEAIRKIYLIGLPSLCHQCSGEVEINDFAIDGDPVAEEM